MRHLLILCLLLAPLSARAEPLSVVASFSILADMARAIGGSEVAVSSLVGPDGDAHVYQPTPADARQVAKADLVIVNGLGFEGWMSRLIQSSGNKKPPLVASTGVAPLKSEDGHGHGKGLDPHAWQSLANAQIYARNIAAALAKAAPDRAETFRAGGEAYAARLAELDSWVRSELATIPPEKRRIVTSHDAFRYFAKSYQVQFLAPVGLSTEAEPSAAGVAKLIRQMKAEKVRAVFIENMTDTRLIEQIGRDAGGVIGGTLYADSLSKPSGPAPDFIAMFRHNVTQLVAAMRQN